MAAASSRNKLQSPARDRGAKATTSARGARHAGGVFAAAGEELDELGKGAKREGRSPLRCAARVVQHARATQQGARH